MKQLFDIAHKDSYKLIQIEDKIFVADQRCERKMRTAGVDKELAQEKFESGERTPLVLYWSWKFMSDKTHANTADQNSSHSHWASC